MSGNELNAFLATGHADAQLRADLAARDREVAQLTEQLTARNRRIGELHELCGAERLALDCRIADQRVRLSELQDERDRLSREVEELRSKLTEADCQFAVACEGMKDNADALLALREVWEKEKREVEELRAQVEGNR